MTTSRRTFLALAGTTLAAAGLAACAPGATAPTAGPTSADPTDGALDGLDAVFAEAFAAAGLAGAAAYVRLGGEEWSQTAGVADLESETPFEAGDYVRIASISKTYTATCILRMVDDGLLSLDDVLETYVPGIANGDVITLRQMLAMQSGIYDFTSNAPFLAAFDANPTMAWSIDDTIAIIKANPPAFEPGAQVVYCDSNYALLGHIAELVDGVPLAEVVTRRAIEPLGLTETYYPTEAGIRDPHPTPYVPVVSSDGSVDTSAEPTIVEEVNPAVPGGAGAMISTLSDLSAWGDELASGTLLTPETQAERLKTTRFEGQTLDFGYGLGITNFNEYLGHDGAIYGFSTVVLTRPQTGTQIAIVSNESTNFTTPTLTIAIAIINAIDPEQGTGA
ncbi:serine hydrolase domain-containing protein [Microbacterium invictum]|uniref:Serine hydrolase domain-containing protein n=1 Tax=Microbacterium invictum TaxID=515415 RepID=A0ABZ0VEK3_9MICO|nr:serine hydrolase domain-containing protein [Microbacterium invictum]WQB70237.1 serine hydrolase domain-containing protein [Microbacterium invictum]